MLDQTNQNRLPDNIVVPFPLAQEILTYLSRQPYNQVFGLVDALRNCTAMMDGGGRNQEAKKPAPVKTPPTKQSASAKSE